MGKRAANLWLLSALAVGFAACSQDKLSTVDPNLLPARYKDEILDTLRTVFDKNETQTVTNAMISDLALRPVGSEQRYTVCRSLHRARHGLQSVRQRGTHCLFSMAAISLS